MLVDANILLYSVDESSPFHASATSWLTTALNGPRRVGLPWASLIAFLRIVTNPRALEAPLTPAEAWEIIDGWLGAPAAWVPSPGAGHHEILRQLTIDHDLRADLVPDASLAALAIEHGLDIVSAESAFGSSTRLPAERSGDDPNADSARVEDQLGAAKEGEGLGAAGDVGIPYLGGAAAVQQPGLAGDHAFEHRPEEVRLELDRREAARALW